jgi:lipopolysaccharide/colanic/teichoic acid biosynthesis glycosyltransferase
MSEILGNDNLTQVSRSKFSGQAIAFSVCEVSPGQFDELHLIKADNDDELSARSLLQAKIFQFSISKFTPEAAVTGLPAISAGQVMAKRAFDVAASVFAIFLLSPAFLIITVILAFQKGPILFAQERIGKGGKMFHCYKFRTMRVGADVMLAKVLAQNPARRAEWMAKRKLAHDPRITTLGNILRLTSLDEIPQLLNILKGDMSVVGPRPIVRKEIRMYQGYYRHYLAVKPGLTGLWQVSGRNSTTYRRRVALDVAYVNNFSLGLDARIIARTVPALFRTDEIS